MPLEPILGLKRAAVLLLELPQLVVDIKGAAEVRLPQPLAKLRQVAKAVEELLATLLEGLVLCHGGHRSLRRDCYVTTSQRRVGCRATSIAYVWGVNMYSNRHSELFTSVTHTRYTCVFLLGRKKATLSA